ncbi:MAG: hypothetical protein IH919_07835 [Deltaproteobacteria bacterium]|nr:hypothetical protein [Deltaproteobacteria bacterium]
MPLVGDPRLIRRDEVEDVYDHLQRILCLSEEMYIREAGAANFIRRDILPRDIGKEDWNWTKPVSCTTEIDQVVCLYGIHVDVKTPAAKRIKSLEITVEAARRGIFDLTTFYLPFPLTGDEQQDGFYYSPVAYFNMPYIVLGQRMWQISPNGSEVDALAPLLGYVLERDAKTVVG